MFNSDDEYYYYDDNEGDNQEGSGWISIGHNNNDDEEDEHEEMDKQVQEDYKEFLERAKELNNKDDITIEDPYPPTDDNGTGKNKKKTTTSGSTRCNLTSPVLLVFAAVTFQMFCCDSL